MTVKTSPCLDIVGSENFLGKSSNIGTLTLTKRSGDRKMTRILLNVPSQSLVTYRVLKPRTQAFKSIPTPSEKLKEKPRILAVAQFLMRANQLQIQKAFTVTLLQNITSLSETA